MASGPFLTDCRRTGERRALSWKTMVFGYTRSRRTAVRRFGEPESLFGDWYHPWLFLLSLGIMLMSCLDAFLTLQLLGLGMIEANPVMAAAMVYGTEAFVISKLAVTGFAIMTLVFFSRVHFFSYVRTGLFLTLFFCLYCCLICYELLSLMALTPAA